jgi:hypothetical protein
MIRKRPKGIWIFVALTAIAVAGYLYMDLRDYLGLTTLSLRTAVSAWGNKDFSPENFRGRSQEQRALQVVHLIRSNRFIGKTIQMVTSELGPHDAYYNSDEIPAYTLPKINGDSWALVFLPDSSGTIQKIIIHKECCYHGILNLVR